MLTETKGRLMAKFSPTVRGTLANISWMSFDKLIRIGGALLVNTVVARYLGPARFGIFSYAYAIYALFNILSSLGLDLLVVRDVSLEPDSEDETLGTSFLLKVGASLLTTAAGILCGVLLKPGEPETIEIIALLSIASVFQGFDVVGFFFQAKLLSRLTILPSIIVFITASAARALAVLFHSTLIVFAWIAALEIVGTQLCLGAAYLWHRKRLPKWKFSLQRARNLLKASWPLMLSAFLIIIYMRCDQIILGAYSTPTVVGNYSAAVKLVELWYSVPLIICGSVMPQLLRIKAKDQIAYDVRLQRLYDILVLASFVVAICAMLFGKTVIAIVFGNQFTPAYPILCVYVWTGVFVFIGIAGGQQMTYDGLATLQLRRSIIGAVTNVVLNLLLVPTFGAIGSAVSTLIVQSFVSYFIDFFDRRTREMFWTKTRACLLYWLFDRTLWKKLSFSPFAAG
jgi:O-antigen/teichoic acid export membrane protein